MYTIMRLLGELDDDFLDRAIAEFGSAAVRTKSGMSIDVAKDGSWDVHTGAILDCVGRLGRLGGEGRVRCAVVDVAIEPEDRNGRYYVCFGFGAETLHACSRAGVGISITVY